MLSLRLQNITVQFDRDGDKNFDNGGIGKWYGKPVLIRSGPYMFHFDLEGRVQRIDGFASPHSWDWVRRTMANDWIYYDKVWQPGSIPLPSGIIGDYAWAVNGRTDLPMLLGHNGPQRDYVQEAFNAFNALIDDIKRIVAGLSYSSRNYIPLYPPSKRELRNRPEAESPPLKGDLGGCGDLDPEVFYESGQAATPEDKIRLWDFLAKAAGNDRGQLQTIANTLHEIHGRMLVLPPDTINVDYKAILVKVMDGCTNNCGFCSVRGESPFALRSKDDIDRQIDALAELYGADLYNYNSVVLGECNALASPLIEYAAKRAFDVLRCGASFHTGSNLFLFSTNRTLLEQSGAFDMLESLPFEKVYINIGWEAATDAALSQLKKQQTANDVLSGMEKAGNLNRKHDKVKISGNFIIADGFECCSIVDAIRQTKYCGQLYLSPLHGECSSKQALIDLQEIRSASPDIRVHLYTMQRI